MRNRLVLSTVMAAVGAALLIAAANAGTSASRTAAAAPKSGGTFTFSKSIGITYVDPALSYFADEWGLEYLTCAKLMNYPDKPAPQGSVAYPEAALGLPRIGNGGKTYTWTIRKGFRFDTGQPLTAAAFKVAFDRDASGKMNSPAISYEHEIVGADAYNSGVGTGVRGVVARGNKLTIHLTRAAPDFVTRMTMPFFCSLPPNTKADPNGVEKPAGAGPYYFSQYTPDRIVVLKRNPYYRGNRPRHAAQIVTKLNNASLEACRLELMRGSVDYCVDGVPPETYAQIARSYGINKQHGNRPSYFEKPLVGFSYVAMNTQRPIWKKNVKLRKAVNMVLNRPALIAQGGFHSGVPTDQALPPSMPGFRDIKAYPLKPTASSLSKAKALANGNTRSGKVVLYQGNRAPRPQRAAVIKANLAQLGLDVDVQLMSRATQKERTGRRNEPFDMTDEGWIADYIDPFSFIGALLNGNSIQETENTNYSYFNVPKYNRAIEAAGRLAGAARFKAFGNLDAQLMTANDAVPWAPYQNFITRDFVSKHVGCYVYNPLYGFDYAAMCRQ